MKSLWHGLNLRAGLVVLMTGAVVFFGTGSGCDRTGDNYDYDVPTGQGVLVVDNQTIERLTVYVNGGERLSVRGNHDEGVDLSPGHYRVAFLQHDGDREYADDIDILEGRQTILKVANGRHSDDYDVTIDHD
jgi:hypothetical protein